MWGRCSTLWRSVGRAGARRTPPASQSRSATTTTTGALLPEPQRTPLGLMGLVAAVVPGLLLGAAISKNIANFLEENDLFVPSDDDDDDD